MKTTAWGGGGFLEGVVFSDHQDRCLDTSHRESRMRLIQLAFFLLENYREIYCDLLDRV